MSGVLDLSSGAFTSSYNGVTRFNTADRGLFNKVPGVKITLNNYNLTFPELDYEVIYHLARNTTSLGLIQHGSHSWTQIVPAEYGPSGSGMYNIPDVVVGTLPAGTTYLDVRGTIQVNQAPSWLVSPYTTQNIIPMTSTDFMRLEGGSIIVSSDFKVVRMMSLIISGTNLVLRRRISVGTQGGNWLNLTNSETAFDRWSTRALFAQANPRWWGMLGTNIDQVNFGSRTITEAKRDGSESSSTNAVAAGISYACSYTCNFEITPCRIQS